MSENQPQTPDAPRPDGDAFDAATLRVPVTSDRDDAAARIAELVRRSNERSSAAPAPATNGAPTSTSAPAPAPTSAPAPAPTAAQAPAQAPPVAPAADPAGEATQAWPAPAADPDATQAWQPVAEHRPQAPLDPEATQAMAPVVGAGGVPRVGGAPAPATQAMSPVGAEPTQAVRYASSGVSEVTPVAPLDYDATAQVPLPTAAGAAHTTAFESPAVTPAPAGPAAPQRRGLPVPSWAIVAGVVAVIALLVWAFTGGGGSGAGQGNASAGSKAGAGQAAPAGFQVRLSDTVTDCAAHSRGKVKETFRSMPCVKVTRSVGTGTVNGHKVLFVVSRIEMSSSDDAARIKAVLDGDGTGNVNDLLREGKRFAGGPRRMPPSGYASVQADEIVGVAEAGYLDGSSSDSDPALRDAAAQVAESVGTH